jgi:integrase
MAMPVAKITKSIVDRMQPWSVIWDRELKGFGVRRHGTDGKHFLLRYRFNGRQTFRKIGRFASPWTVEMARAEALRLLGQIVTGTNPAIADRRGATFGQELPRYLEHKVGVKPATLRQMSLYLRKQAASLHSMELASIDRRAIAQLLSDVERGSGPFARNRMRSSLSAFFAWLIREGLLDVNPVSGTGKASEASRDRVLTQSELVAIWRALGDDDPSDVIRLLILTGQRRDEITRMSWSEVDWDREMLVLPQTRTKNGLRHELPLSPLALAILRKRYAGTGNGKGNDGPVFKSLSWSHQKAQVDARLKIAPWRIHDIRRSVATGMGELGVLPHIIECVLNHVSGHKAGVAGIYNKSKNTDAMREALVRWAAHVEQITRT